MLYADCSTAYRTTDTLREEGIIEEVSSGHCDAYSSR